MRPSSQVKSGILCRSFYHCSSFEPCLSFFTVALTNQQPQAGSPSYDRFLMQAMVLLHQVLSCRAYKGIPESLSLGSDPEQHVSHPSLPSASRRSQNLDHCCPLSWPLSCPLTLAQFQYGGGGGCCSLSAHPWDSPCLGDIPVPLDVGMLFGVSVLAKAEIH